MTLPLFPDMADSVPSSGDDALPCDVAEDPSERGPADAAALVMHEEQALAALPGIPAPAPIAVPAVIRAAFAAGADCAISISGGKDSQALLRAIAAWFRAQGFPGQCYAIHADLGRAEWPQTPGHVERIAADSNVPLAIVRREQGDLIARFEERMTQLEGTGKPFWPSAAARYCTSDLKRGPINKHLRQHRLVVSVEGTRGQESRKRARDHVAELRREITGSTLRDLAPMDALAAWTPATRLALTWRPLQFWTLDDVWHACGTTAAELADRRARHAAGHPDALGPWSAAIADDIPDRRGPHSPAQTDRIAYTAAWPCHPAYVWGNARLSCAFCILATRNDLTVGARHNPELYRHLVTLERRSGATFKADLALAELAPELLEPRDDADRANLPVARATDTDKVAA